MRTSRRVAVRLFGLLLWVGVATMCRAADDWAAPAADLAHQIAALTGPGVVSLSVRDSSSIAAEEVPVIRRNLVSELGKLGVTVRLGGDTATSLRVTLSQTARQGLWVAEVQQGPEVRVAMVTVANAAPAAAQQGTMFQLRKTLVFSQEGPILDVGMIALGGDVAATHVVVLGAEQIGIYHRDDKMVWVKGQSFEVAHGRPYPRDMRGRLQMDAAGGFKAYLPGVICTGSQRTSSQGAAVAVACADSDDPWPIGARKAFYNSSRNYFTGVMVPGQGAELGPFYSAAELVEKHGSATVYSEVSGQVRVSDASGLKALAGTRDWGSDVAGVQSGCGSGAQVLVSTSGDAMQESLMAYEIAGRDAIAVSAPTALDGRVTAMWPMDGAAVMMIVEKQQPVAYEAYSVSVVCN